MTVRQAEAADEEDVVAFTADTWDGSDYIPQVFADWVDSDGPRQRTLVADLDGDVVGIVQFSLVSEYEAWAQGMRVDPDHRGGGIGMALNHAGFDWARQRGATVARNMVFSWNIMGLGLSRALGFEPVAEFRYAHPEPNAEATVEADITAEPAAAWNFWTTSRAREALAGLSLHSEESWCLAALDRERLQGAADDDRLIVIQDDGTAGFAYRNRTYEREHDGSERRHAEYGVAAWHAGAAEPVLAAIARDAATVGAERTRVLIPETPAAVSDVAAARVEVAEEPDFVMARDLTAPTTRR
ncbi:MAG: N-acetyltransferase family protein [Halobacteriaceae archaeon]